MRLALIKGQSAYGSTRTFIDQAAAAFARKGHEPIIIDRERTSEILSALGEAARAAPLGLVYSIGAYGEVRNDEGQYIGDIARAPHVVQQVDYPLTNLERIQAADAKCAQLVIDESHTDVIDLIRGTNPVAYAGFCPHAAIGEAAVSDSERPIGVLFAATFYKADKPWANAANGMGKRVFDTAFEIAISEEFVPALEAMDRAITACKLDPANPALAPLRRAAHVIHEEVRKTRRFQLLKTAAKIGMPVHVYGAGYESQLYRLKNIIYHGEAPLTEVTAAMRKSRIVLSANANFGKGSHERPLSALLAGALAATDTSSFYEREFADGRSIALYRWMNLEAGLAKIAALAEDAAACAEMAERGQIRVLAHHMWDNRVETIVAAAEAARSRPALASAA